MDLEKGYQCINPHMEKLETGTFMEIDRKFQKNPDVLLRPFLQDMDQVMKEVVNLQKQNRKGSIRYISFSILHTNLLLKKNEARVDFMDQNMWFDEQEIVGRWGLDLFFEKVDESFQNIIKSFSAEYLQCKPHEATGIYRNMQGETYAFAFLYLPKLINEIQTLRSFQEMKKEDEIIVTVGEFRDRTKELCRITKG